MSVTCPVCGATSDTIYRCDRCGKDLVDESEDHDGRVTDGGCNWPLDGGDQR